MPRRIFNNTQIERLLAVMVMENPDFHEPCQALRVMFFCLPGDSFHVFTPENITNHLDALLYQRPDYAELVKVFCGYIGLRNPQAEALNVHLGIPTALHYIDR